MKLLDIIPESELLTELLRAWLLIQTAVLGKEEDCLRQEACWEAVEELLKTQILTKFHHSAQKGQEIVDCHQLISELVHLEAPCDCEYIELFSHDLQKCWDSQRKYPWVGDLILGQLKEVHHAVDKWLK